MKKIILTGAFCTLAVFGGSQAAFAETTTPEPMLISAKPTSDSASKIQELMKLIADLKAKMAEAKGQIEVLSKDLSLGAQGDDVMKAQELLASDPSILKAKPTGFFGPLTEDAIKKFQAKYSLPVTGKLDEATREVMKELRSENKDGKVPPGFLKSKEVHDKIKARLQEKWGDCVWEEKFSASDCKKGKNKSDKGDKGEHASSTKDHGEKKEYASSTKATMETATAAIASAQTAIDKLTADIAAMKTGSSTDKQIKEAQKRLGTAKVKMARAEKNLDLERYRAATMFAKEAMKIAGKPAKKMEKMSSRSEEQK